MPSWADSPADWEALIAVLVSISVIVGYLIRAEVRRTGEATKVAKEQLLPNHGTSLRDAVDRIEAHVLRTEAKLDRHIEHHLDMEDQR